MSCEKASRFYNHLSALANEHEELKKENKRLKEKLLETPKVRVASPDKIRNQQQDALSAWRKQPTGTPGFCDAEPVPPPDLDSRESSDKVHGKVASLRRISEMLQFGSDSSAGDYCLSSRSSTMENGVGCVQQLRCVIQSAAFECVVAILVTVNAGFSAAEMQYNGMALGRHLGFPDYESSVFSLGEKRMFELVDLFFTSVFAVELLLRIALLRMDFFRAALNWLDVIAVAASLANIMMVDGAGSASVVRLLRLVKLSRGLRLVRMARVLESLHFLLQSMRASLSTLFWSLCVLLIIQCISGMFLNSLVTEYLNRETEDLKGRMEVFKYYGTFTRTMITMFEIHLANWAPACRVLIDNVDEWIGYVFIAYRCLAGFAVLNVINAVFIQQTLRVAQQDQQLMILQQQKVQEQNRRNIMALFDELDRSGDGFLSRDEFNILLTDSRLKTWLSCLDIDLTDVTHLINLLDDGKGDISATEFLRRLSSIKGPAKSIDMAELLARTARMEHKMNKRHVEHHHCHPVAVEHHHCHPVFLVGEQAKVSPSPKSLVVTEAI